MNHPNFIRAFWYMSNNFGDNLNYYLIKALSGKEPVYTDIRGEKHYIVCGSILSEAGYNTTVWGAGLGAADQRPHHLANIIAVRGELSKSKIEQQPIAVGDPALLMPRFYNPAIEKKHKVGILPHWKDLEKVLWMNLDALVISPLQPVEKVANDILSCEVILSSSLHGLIFADAYGVPNKWIDLGSNIGGDGFKFRDYYSTTDNPDAKPCYGLSPDNARVNKYKFSLDEFYNSCPFKK